MSWELSEAARFCRGASLPRSIFASSISKTGHELTPVLWHLLKSEDAFDFGLRRQSAATTALLGGRNAYESRKAACVQKRCRAPLATAVQKTTGLAQ